MTDETPVCNASRPGQRGGVPIPVSWTSERLKNQPLFC